MVRISNAHIYNAEEFDSQVEKIAGAGNLTPNIQGKDVANNGGIHITSDIVSPEKLADNRAFVAPEALSNQSLSLSNGIFGAYESPFREQSSIPQEVAGPAVGAPTVEGGSGSFENAGTQGGINVLSSSALDTDTSNASTVSNPDSPGGGNNPDGNPDDGPGGDDGGGGESAPDLGLLGQDLVGTDIDLGLDLQDGVSISPDLGLSIGTQSNYVTLDSFDIGVNGSLASTLGSTAENLTQLTGLSPLAEEGLNLLLGETTNLLGLDLAPGLQANQSGIGLNPDLNLPLGNDENNIQIGSDGLSLNGEGGEEVGAVLSDVTGVLGGLPNQDEGNNLGDTDLALFDDINEVIAGADNEVLNLLSEGSQIIEGDDNDVLDVGSNLLSGGDSIVEGDDNDLVDLGADLLSEEDEVV
jgi:hypothetical protein